MLYVFNISVSLTCSLSIFLTTKLLQMHVLCTVIMSDDIIGVDVQSGSKIENYELRKKELIKINS